MGETGEGYIYIANVPGERPDNIPVAEWNPAGPYLLVLDNSGSPLYYKSVVANGSSLRSFPSETMLYFDHNNGNGRYTLLDRNGNEGRSYQTQGAPPDSHDILLLDNGNAMMFYYDNRIMDMTAYGGHANAEVMNVIIQEIDSNNSLVWEWNGWDYFEFEDMARPNLLEREFVDIVHANGLAIDHGGNVLLSSRHLDEITNIDYETGEIIWRMGGEHDPNNEFTFVNDPFNGFSAQHTPVVLENGNLLLFDNGTRHDPQISRVVEYEVDEDARTATLVWSYADGRYSQAAGSVQRLENGNTFIGWGRRADDTGPEIAEVTRDGEVVFELDLAQGGLVYRAYRLPFYGDRDLDAVLDVDDNCPAAANPDQADNWGSDLGDACDTEWYGGDDGVKAFQQKDNTFHIWGCDEGECHFVANFDPKALTPENTPQRFESEESMGWYIDVQYLDTDDDGNDIYQVSAYDTEVLRDDKLEIIVKLDAIYEWRARD